mmetsp:Transcript_4554/g.6772  ORF Transcript_4554/g.6772 Transcript_4554/m.6772 type:complete len:555 (+) Transcript_4554:320-1984(+)
MANKLSAPIETSTSTDSDELDQRPTVVDKNNSVYPEQDDDNDNDGAPLVDVPMERPVSWKTLWIDWPLLAKYMGPGWLMSLAYLDPGNLESDLQNGALAEYTLLWVLLWATIAGLVLQSLSAKLGVVTGQSLAQVCRSEYKPAVRYILWVMTEIAIIGSDIQEVLGSAIAWKILLGIPIWAGVLITGLDTFVFLGLHHFGVRLLETFIFVLVLTMMICFWVNMIDMKPSAEGIIVGTLNFTSLPPYAVSLAVGTLGCVIMPHNLYLHSALVRSRKIDRKNLDQVAQANKYNKIESTISLFFSFLINLSVVSTFAAAYFDVFCSTQETQEARLPLDMCSAQDILDGPNGPTCCGDIGLSVAGSALENSLGKAGLYIWAVGLLAAGQASTLTGTLAGQYVMEGFLNIHMPVWKRLVLTRSIALVPAIAVGIMASTNAHLTDQVNQWLNVLQSIQLPFALLPVLHFTSDRRLMQSFTNGLITQSICWLLAFVLLAVNFLAIFQQFLQDGEASWVLPVFIVAFVIYALFVAYVGYPGFKNFCMTIRYLYQRRNNQDEL